MRIHPSLRALASTGFLGGAALAAASCSLVLGIGDPSLDPAGGTGGKGGSGGGSVKASQSSADAATTTGGGGATTYPCTPTDPSCSQVTSDCLSVFDNASRTTFALRIGQLNFYQPTAFNGDLQKAAFLASVTMNLPKCNLKGSGAFSWIVSVDKAAGTFQFGAAKPPAFPLDGYSFVNETIPLSGQMFPVAPVSGTMTLDADGTFQPDTLESVVVPAYLDAQATSLILVPLHKVRLFETKISADQNCIGSHNVAGLSPSDGCLPNISKNISSFVSGGKLEAFISLEEADEIMITSFGLNRSLCVLLSNDPMKFGNGGSPIKCKRDGMGKVQFNGDWCGSTNLPADAICYDAVSMFAGFAASGVELK